MSIVPINIDVSMWQRDINYPQVKASGIKTVIAKATQGEGINDGYYLHNKIMAKQAGLPFGSYHFTDWDASPSAQAEKYLNVAQPADDELMCLDWEWAGPRKALWNAAQGEEFLRYIYAKTGRYSMIYGGIDVENMCSNSPSAAFFAQHRLWHAQYEAHFNTGPIWKNQPWLWQCDGDAYGPGPHYIPGVSDLCDNSIIVGTMTIDRLLAEWNGASAQVPSVDPPSVMPPDTEAIQTALNTHGAIPPLAVDGIAGKLTFAAIRAFQTKNSLQVDGIVGPITWAALSKPAA
jgi:lysozyme